MKKLNLIIAILIATVHAFAQNLPKTQQESVWITNTKPDGTLPDRDKFFKAYNRAEHISYTIGNDDKTLYLFMFCNERLNLQKLLSGGVTFTVNDAADKNRKVTLTFPTSNYQQNFPVSRFAFNYYSDLSRDKEANKQQIADLKVTLTKLIAGNYKEIGVQGIDGITDETISVYNEQGIKAVAAFDNDIALTYELAIPLKYLKISGDKFQYDVQLNPRAMMKVNPLAPPPPMPPGGGSNMTGLYLDSPSNFGGEYQLAKR